MLMFCFVCYAKAQKVDEDILIDSIKAEITRFFVREGLLNKQKVKDSKNFIFATEISQNRPVGYDLNGIYRIGVFQSHSAEHVLIKEGNTFKIFDLKEISILLNEILSFSYRRNINQNIMIEYLKAVIGIYENNQHLGNLKLSKVPQNH